VQQLAYNVEHALIILWSAPNVQDSISSRQIRRSVALTVTNARQLLVETAALEHYFPMKRQPFVQSVYRELAAGQSALHLAQQLKACVVA
jgi:hypothetical protein